jgi:membrane protein DedA with SNARE-associated domain
MEERIIEFLSSPFVSPYVILLVAFLIQFIENLFPPSPSDVVLLFLGSLVSFGRVGFAPLIAVATLGSVLGFFVMFMIGRLFGEKVLYTGKLKFIDQESLEKTRQWFNRWGYGIVVANRFLSGTRAVVSFFAGAAELSPAKTTILAGISAFVWNLLIIYLGMTLGKNWKAAIEFLDLYWKVILAVLIFAVIVYFVLSRMKSNP